MAIDSETTRTRRSVSIGSTRQVIGLLAVLTVLVVGGVVVLPVAVPNLASAMQRNPFVPLLVAACWILATAASIIGKRIIAAGYLNWSDTATAHVGGTVANRVVPAGVGAAGVFVAALHRGGATTKAAAGVVALWAVAGGIAHASGLLLGVAWFREGNQGLLAVVLVVAAVVAGGRLVAKKRAAGPVRPRRTRPRRPRAADGRIHKVMCAARDLVVAVRARPMVAVGALAAQFTATLCLAAGFAIAAVGFGVPVSIGVGMAAYLAGTALSAATPTPAGIGSAETALVGTLMLAGASVGEALPTVLLFRAVILFAPVVAGAVMGAVWLVRRWRAARRGGVPRIALPAVVPALPAVVPALEPAASTDVISRWAYRPRPDGT